MLTAYFQSIRLALVAVATTPAVVAGVTLALYATDTTLNIESFMGAIMAVGVAVANAILLVTFAERKPADGHDPPWKPAILGAHERLRPILMTSCAMIAGMVPMALGLGEGGEQTAPLAGPSSAVSASRLSRRCSCCRRCSRSSWHEAVRAPHRSIPTIPLAVTMMGATKQKSTRSGTRQNSEETVTSVMSDRKSGDFRYRRAPVAELARVPWRQSPEWSLAGSLATSATKKNEMGKVHTMRASRLCLYVSAVAFAAIAGCRGRTPEPASEATAAPDVPVIHATRQTLTRQIQQPGWVRS